MNTNSINYFNSIHSDSDFHFNWFVNFEYLKVNEEDGSITCKVSQDFLEGREEGLVIALYYTSDLNMEIFCDDQCLSNFDMASFLYDSYFDMIYVIPYSVSNKFMEGKEVTIYGHTPDKEERDMIKGMY